MTYLMTFPDGRVYSRKADVEDYHNDIPESGITANSRYFYTLIDHPGAKTALYWNYNKAILFNILA